RYLKAFQIAARNLNFRRAALEMRISASALSRQIALLEQNLGEDLFLRNTRTVSLTLSGKRLLAAVEAFERDSASSSSDFPLRIGSLESVFGFFFVDFIRKYKDAFSGPLDIVIGTPEKLEEMAASSQLDLVFTNFKPKASLNLS